MGIARVIHPQVWNTDGHGLHRDLQLLYIDPESRDVEISRRVVLVRVSRESFAELCGLIWKLRTGEPTSQLASASLIPKGFPHITAAGALAREFVQV